MAMQHAMRCRKYRPTRNGWLNPLRQFAQREGSRLGAVRTFLAVSVRVYQLLGSAINYEQCAETDRRVGVRPFRLVLAPSILCLQVGGIPAGAGHQRVRHGVMAQCLRSSGSCSETFVLIAACA